MVSSHDMQMINELMEKLSECDIHWGLSYRTECYNGESYPTRNWYDWYDKYDSDIHKMGWYAYNGETKVAFINDDCDYVVKLSFDRSTNIDAVANKRVIDFNVREADNYTKAVDSNLDEYFAETICLGEIYGITVFVQEKCDCDTEGICDYLYKYAEQMVDSEYDDRGEDVTEAVRNSDDYRIQVDNALERLCDEDYIYALIPGSDASDLVNFVKENKINDLHEGNWGFIGNRIVLIDFSGYVGV